MQTNARKATITQSIATIACLVAFGISMVLTQPVYASDTPASTQQTAARSSVQDGFVTEDGVTYFYVAGKKATGQRCIKGSWYCFDATSGALLTGFVDIVDQKKRVFYGPDGKMLYGQQCIDGCWYYFDNVTGAMATGFVYLTDQKKWVYYASNGAMVYGQQCINGRWYYFNNVTGATTYGFVYHPDQRKWVFYDRIMGWMLYGEQLIDNGWYYLTPGTGAVDYEWAWLPDSNKWVYYDKVTGRMLHGTHRVDGKICVFDDATGEYFGNTAQASVVRTALARNNFGFGFGWCEAWVETAYAKAGFPGPSMVCAWQAWQKFGISTSRSGIPLGAAVYGHSNPKMGGEGYDDYGHVGIYLPGDKVGQIRNGKVTIDTFSYWADHYSYVGWGWYGNRALA